MRNERGTAIKAMAALSFSASILDYSIHTQNSLWSAVLQIHCATYLSAFLYPLFPMNPPSTFKKHAPHSLCFPQFLTTRRRLAILYFSRTWIYGDPAGLPHPLSLIHKKGELP